METEVWAEAAAEVVVETDAGAETQAPAWDSSKFKKAPYCFSLLTMALFPSC